MMADYRTERRAAHRRQLANALVAQGAAERRVADAKWMGPKEQRYAADALRKAQELVRAYTVTVRVDERTGR